MLYNDVEIARWSHVVRYEESPSTIGQRCQLTAGDGNVKESATEKNRRFGKGENVRQELTSYLVTNMRCKPHLVQVVEAMGCPSASL